MHSYNALASNDAYGKWYGIGDFYTNTDAQTYFDARLVHILNHVHTSLGKPWKELNEYIFGFEAENEAMIGDVSVGFYRFRSTPHLTFLTGPIVH